MAIIKVALIATLTFHYWTTCLSVEKSEHFVSEVGDKSDFGPRGASDERQVPEFAGRRLKLLSRGEKVVQKPGHAPDLDQQEKTKATVDNQPRNEIRQAALPVGKISDDAFNAKLDPHETYGTNTHKNKRSKSFRNMRHQIGGKQKQKYIGERKRQVREIEDEEDFNQQEYRDDESIDVPQRVQAQPQRSGSSTRSTILISSLCMVVITLFITIGVVGYVYFYYHPEKDVENLLMEVQAQQEEAPYNSQNAPTVQSFGENGQQGAAAEEFGTEDHL